MKHIKYFESEINIKKYFIGPYYKDLAIFEVLEEVTDYISGSTKFDKLLKVRMIFIYKIEYKNIIESHDKDPYIKSIKSVNNSIFKSNDIQDCFNIIPYIKDTNKYNL